MLPYRKAAELKTPRAFVAYARGGTYAEDSSTPASWFDHQKGYIDFGQVWPPRRAKYKQLWRHQHCGTSQGSDVIKTKIGGTRGCGLNARSSSSTRSWNASSSSSARRWQTKLPGPFAIVACNSAPSESTKMMCLLSSARLRSLRDFSRASSLRHHVSRIIAMFLGQNPFPLFQRSEPRFDLGHFNGFDERAHDTGQGRSLVGKYCAAACAGDDFCKCVLCVTDR
jgi:hypothetical protein